MLQGEVCCSVFISAEYVLLKKVFLPFNHKLGQLRKKCPGQNKLCEITHYLKFLSRYYRWKLQKGLSIPRLKPYWEKDKLSFRNTDKMSSENISHRLYAGWMAQILHLLHGWEVFLPIRLIISRIPSIWAALFSRPLIFLSRDSFDMLEILPSIFQKYWKV